jgi:hypothetical protein
MNVSQAMRMALTILVFLTGHVGWVAGTVANGADTDLPVTAVTGHPSGTLVGVPFYDFPAMVVRPSDLDRGEYVLANAFMLQIDDEGKIRPEGLVGGRVRHAVRGYYGAFNLPAVGDSADTGQSVETTIYQFLDTAAATSALAFDRSEERFNGRRIVQGHAVVGDDSFIVDGVSDGVIYEYFRLDDLVVAIEIVNFPDKGTIPAAAYPLTVEAVESLATIAQEHVLAVEEQAQGTGLGPVALRLRDARGRVVDETDTYMRLHGEDVPVGETADAYASRIAGYADATDVYVVYQTLYDAEHAGKIVRKQGDTDGYVGYYVEYLRRFPTEDSATRWLTESRQRLADLDPEEGGVLPGDVSFGDASFAVRLAGDDQRWTEVRLYARFGNLVVQIMVHPEASLLAIEDVDVLMTAQAGCLSVGVCEAGLVLPDSLVSD